MYNIIIYLYLCGVAVYSLFNEKVRKMWKGERQAIKILKQKVDSHADYVWFHAASLGEFEQGRPLIEQIRSQQSDLKILLTFFSPSGYEVRKDYEYADIVCYLPLDTPINAIRFLRAIRPKMAFFIKYEFWYNYLHILKHRNVPVYSISSIFRDGQIFFRWYGKQYGRVLNCFTHFYVQNEKSKQLLGSIGIDNVTVSGDTRFDRVKAISLKANKIPALDQFISGKTSPTTVVGSSWEADENVYLPYFFQHPEMPLIIAPHVVSDERIKRLVDNLQKNNRKVVLFSELSSSENSKRDTLHVADTMIIDCYGLLSSIYQYADIAYVGGGFGTGIHNILEAAVWKIPVLFGPNNSHFQEAHDLKLFGGGIEVCCKNSFRTTMERLSTDNDYRATAGKAAYDYVESHTGATEKILNTTIFRR